MKIENPKDYEICKFDGVTVSSVYAGTFENLRQPQLVWRKQFIEHIGMDLNYLNLDEIREQVVGCGQDVKITIFIEEPMKRTVIQYGSEGRYWSLLGEIKGYA